MSALFAATYPERTRALILCGTFATGTLDPDDNPAGQRWVDEIQRVLDCRPSIGARAHAWVFAPSADSERDRIGRGIFERSAATPQMTRTLLDMVIETDVRDVLPTHPRADAGPSPRARSSCRSSTLATSLSTFPARGWSCFRERITYPSMATPTVMPRRSRSSSRAPAMRLRPIASSRP